MMIHRNSLKIFGIAAFVMLAVFCVPETYAEDIVYRTNRTFTATTTTIGSATVYNIANTMSNLTGIIVGGSPISTNSQFAIEYEAVSWGQTSFNQAWHNVTNSYLGIGTYTNIFDDPGWIKGTKSVTFASKTTYGAYMWILQNTLNFTTPGSTYYSNNGHTYLLDKVLVGTLGDYQPGTTYEEKFPEINEVNTNYPDCTYLTNSQPADDSSETVKYSFDTKAYYRLIVPTVNIDGDYDRNGEYNDHLSEAAAVTFEGPKGYVIMSNFDDDDGDGNPDVLQDNLINTNDLADIYELHIDKLGISSNLILSSWTMRIEVLDPISGESSSAARLFHKREVGTAGGSGLDYSSNGIKFWFAGTGSTVIGIEGKTFGTNVCVQILLKDGTNVISSDKIQILLAPYFVAPNSFDTETFFFSSNNEIEITNALAGVCSVTNVGATGIYIQDHVEFGYTRTGVGQSSFSAMQVILGIHSKGPSLSDQVDNDTAYCFYAPLNQEGGNLMVTPPTSGNDGYIVCGNNLTITNFLEDQAVQTLPDGSLLTVDAEWLKIPHVDNLVSFLPVGSGYKVLVADLELATNILLTTTNMTVDGAPVTASWMRSKYSDATNAANIAAIKTKLATLRSTLTSKLGISSSDLIKVPVAFRPDSLAVKIRSYLPNLVNMQYVGNGASKRVLVPLAYYFPFQADLDAKLLSMGFNTSNIPIINTIDDFNNGKGGDVHCISNPLLKAPTAP